MSKHVPDISEISKEGDLATIHLKSLVPLPNSALGYKLLEDVYCLENGEIIELVQAKFPQVLWCGNELNTYKQVLCKSFKISQVIDHRCTVYGYHVIGDSKYLKQVNVFGYHNNEISEKRFQRDITLQIDFSNFNRCYSSIVIFDR